MIEEQLLYKLAINQIPSIGAVYAKTLVSYCGGIKEAFHSTKKDLLKIPGIGPKKVDAILNSKALLKAELELKRLEGTDIKVLSYWDPGYPTALKEYEDAPLVLYLRGNINFNYSKVISIVGTRKITPQGTKICEKLVSDLEPYNCLLVSGLAYGVDTVAHRTAVECNIATIGILGHGIDKLYPYANRKIAEKMMLNGGIMTEFPTQTKPDKVNFPKRNRIIAALSDAVIVIESGQKGGSIITAEYANNYSKDVFAFPGRIDDPYSQGCNHLIKTHKAHLCTGIEDLVYIMRWEEKEKPKQLEMLLDLPSELQELIELIKNHPEIRMDNLHYKTKRPLASISKDLLTLEFKGLLKTLPGKKYILTH